jgi:prepilin-type N-terminal cleavage/methylation domain-containing protein
MYSPRQRTRLGFSLIEMLVVTAITATLVAVLMPALSKARAAAKTTVCANTQRQLGVAINSYASDYRNEAPIAWGAATDHTGYYASIIEGRAGNWMYYGAGSPIGLALLYEKDYLPNPRLFYCAGIASDDDEGGYRSNKGWNPTGGRAHTTSYTISSYYYRYVDGASPAIAKVGRIYDTGDALTSVDAFKAEIDLLITAAPAALWCSCHRGIYHPEGYNVLAYSGAVRFLNRSMWPLGFPRNVWWDWTDCWGNEGDGLGYSAYPDFEFWDVADRVAR